MNHRSNQTSLTRHDWNREKNRILAANRLLEFATLAWPLVEPNRELIRGWHLEAICEHLQAVALGQIRNLLITVPPGHMKSLTVSVFWPAWMWIARPAWRLLCCSYSRELAEQHARRSSDLVQSDWFQETFQPTWRMDRRQNRKGHYVNTRSGSCMSLSVGGQATGFRGDAIVVDDPLNVRDQGSRRALDNVISWWDQIMSSRLNDPSQGVKVIIAQRLHERDLVGHCLAQGGYEHLSLPSEFEPERRTVTVLGFEDPRRQPGELLFPGLYPRGVIATARRTLGSYGFAAQHQQHPSPADGGIFKRPWFRFWQKEGDDLKPIRVRMPDGSVEESAITTLPESFDGRCQSWDCAFKDLKDSDYVVGQVWARKGSRRFLLDQFRHIAGFPKTVEAVREMTVNHPDTGAKYIEDKANGSAVIQTLNVEISGIIPVNPEGGKVSRAFAVSPQIEAGNIFLPHPDLCPWVDAFIEECMQFPNGLHDDQVDAMTQALSQWNLPLAALYFLDD